MGRNIEINIPMFIGIILLIAIVTSILVLGTNKVKDLMYETGYDYHESSNTIESWFNRNTLNDEQINNDNTNSYNANLFESSNIIY